MTSERALVDTNVLLSATDESRERHVSARRLLEDDDRVLTVSPQVVREYLSVASRPVGANGLGLDGAEAVANVRTLLDRLDLVAEPMSAIDTTLALVRDGTVAGKQVHDAHLVAVALACQIPRVVTGDADHFARFAHMVIIEPI